MQNVILDWLFHQKKKKKNAIHDITETVGKILLKTMY